MILGDDKWERGKPDDLALHFNISTSAPPGS